MKIAIIGNINNLADGGVDGGQNSIRIAQAWTLQRHNVRLFPFTPQSVDNILKFAPTICLVTQGKTFDHRLLMPVREAGVFLVQWIPDEYAPGDIPGGLWFETVKNVYHLALVETRGIIPALKEEYFDDVVWVPQFFDQRFFGAFEKRLQYYDNSDLGFVGGPNIQQSTIRQTFLKRLIKDKYALKIAGGVNELWGGIAGIDSDLPLNYFIGDGILTGPELTKFFLRTKISLNFINDLLPQYELGMSNRAFKCLGAGGFLLTHEIEGLEELILPGKHCATYSPTCYGSLIEKVRYFLKNSTEREKIAIQGQQHILKEYNIDKVTALFLEEIGKRL